MSRVDVSPDLLRWAIERNNLQIDDYLKKTPQLLHWINGEKSPTFKQLQKFAKQTYTPLGYFFLSEVPKEENPIVDYRTISKTSHQKISLHLRSTIYEMQRRQNWLSERLREIDAGALDFVGSARLTDPPESVGKEIRKKLNINQHWLKSIRTVENAVSKFRSKIEDLRIMAVINGVVGNNNNRRLNINEFRGFALVDSYAPLIFVNGVDSKSAQMFTLAHELAHIWLGEEGISGFEFLLPNDAPIEQWCNKVTAELLVPKKHFEEEWGKCSESPNQYQNLSNTFKVSPLVISRRALDCEFINKKEWLAFYNNYSSLIKSNKPKSKGGGNYYKNLNFKVGKLFATEIAIATREGKLGFQKAFDLIGEKGDTFKKYTEEELGILLN